MPSAGGDRPGAAGRDAALVIVVMGLLGVLGGVLWSALVTPADYTKLANGASMGDDQLGRQFGADGWYVVIAALTALVAGAVLARWRSRDLLATSAALVVGSVLAAVAMALTGHLLGPGDPEAALASAKVGALVPERLDVGVRPLTPFADYVTGSVSVYLTWPVGALTGVLLVLVGRGPQDDGPHGSSKEPDITSDRPG